MIRTRKGLDWTVRFPGVACACAALPDGIVGGEIVALDADGAPDFTAMQAWLAEGTTEQLVLFAFDLLHAGGQDLRPLKLSERKARLRALLGGSLRRIRPSSASTIISTRAATPLALCPSPLAGRITSKQANAP